MSAGQVRRSDRQKSQGSKASSSTTENSQPALQRVHDKRSGLKQEDNAEYVSTSNRGRNQDMTGKIHHHPASSSPPNLKTLLALPTSSLTPNELTLVTAYRNLQSYTQSSIHQLLAFQDYATTTLCGASAHANENAVATMDTASRVAGQVELCRKYVADCETMLEGGLALLEQESDGDLPPSNRVFRNDRKSLTIGTAGEQDGRGASQIALRELFPHEMRWMEARMWERDLSNARQVMGSIVRASRGPVVPWVTEDGV